MMLEFCEVDLGGFGLTTIPTSPVVGGPIIWTSSSLISLEIEEALDNVLFLFFVADWEAISTPGFVRVSFALILIEEASVEEEIKEVGWGGMNECFEDALEEGSNLSEIN